MAVLPITLLSSFCANCTLAQCSSVWDDNSASTAIPEGCWGRDFSGPICTSNGECQLQWDCQDDRKSLSSQQPVFNKQGLREDGLQVVVLLDHLTHWDTNTGMIYYLPGWMWSLWPAPTPSLPGSGRNDFSIFKQEQTEMIRHFPMKGGL